MTTSLYDNGYPIDWGCDVEDDGHRTYYMVQLVECDAGDGPVSVLFTAGLPVPGTGWIENVNTFATDPWTFCYPTRSVRAHMPKQGERPTLYQVKTKFSTRPLKRCCDTDIGDPLLEPQKVSGSFVKESREATKDRNGNAILYPNKQRIRGDLATFDEGRDGVRIEQNVASLENDVFSAMRNHVNDQPIWNMAPRTVKLSNVTWEQKFYGKCNVYYTRIFDFEMNANTFDRNITAQGTNVLNGHWDASSSDQATTGWIIDPINGKPPDPNNPQHFIHFKDRHGENAHTLLDSNGMPAIADILSNTGYVYTFFAGGTNNALFSISGATLTCNTLLTTAVGPTRSIKINTHPPSGPDFQNTFVVPILQNCPSGTDFGKFWTGIFPGASGPATTQTVLTYQGKVATVHVEKYSEADFTLLGIPTEL